MAVTCISPARLSHQSGPMVVTWWANSDGISLVHCKETSIDVLLREWRWWIFRAAFQAGTCLQQTDTTQQWAVMVAMAFALHRRGGEEMELVSIAFVRTVAITLGSFESVGRLGRQKSRLCCRSGSRRLQSHFVHILMGIKMCRPLRTWG